MGKTRAVHNCTASQSRLWQYPCRVTEKHVAHSGILNADTPTHSEIMSRINWLPVCLMRATRED